MPYDAFISYSHSADGRLAPAVQLGLQRLARPWYRIRALRVFRDETGLAVNPHLWGSIQSALDDSSYFVLLASPASAGSAWVNREIDHWIVTKPADRILPVLTEGSWEWDEARGDFAEGANAVPIALRGRFEGEPRYLDLRWARNEDELDLRHSRFREAIADLAAPIHGMAKDELESEDVRRHRNGMRLARAAVLALVVFAATAAVATLFAFGSAARANEQADRARLAATQAREAEETARRREAEAVEARKAEEAAAQRALVSAADAQRAADEARAAEAAAAEERDRAQEAETNARSAEAARALEAARAEASARTAEREAERARTSARAAEAANLLAQTRRNEALRALRDAERSAAGARAHALVNSAFNLFDEGRFDLGMLLAAESRNEARESDGVVSVDLGRNALLTGLLSEPTLRTTLHGSGDGMLEMAFDPTGERIASLDLGGWVHVWDVHGARVIAAKDVGAVRGLTLSSNGVVGFVDEFGNVGIWDIASGVTTLVDRQWSFVDGVALSHDGSLLAVIGNLSTDAHNAPLRVLLWDVARGVQVGPWLETPARYPLGVPLGVLLAFDSRGDTLVAAGTDGSTEYVSVWTVATAVAGDPRPDRVLEGSHRTASGQDPLLDPLTVADVHFVGGELWTLTSGSTDGALAGWNLATGERLFGPGGPTGRVMAMSPDHRVVAQLSDDGATHSPLLLRDVLTGEQVGPPLAAIASRGDLGEPGVGVEFSPDGRTLAGFGDAGTIPLWDWTEDPVVDWRIRTSTPLPIEPSSANVVALAPDGSLIALGHAGSVQVLDEAGQPLPRQPDANPVDEIRPLAFSSDGAMLATFEQDSTIRIWDTTSGNLRWELPVPAGCGSGLLSFGPPGPRGGGGTVALGCFSEQLPEVAPTMAWRLTSPHPVPQVLPHFGIVGDPLAFSPDGRNLVLNDVRGSGLTIVDIDSGNTVRSLTGDGDDIANDAAFDARGQRLAISYQSGALEVVDLPSGERRIRRGAHDATQSDPGTEVVLDPSGRTLYSVSRDGTARMWDVATFEPIGSALTAPTPLSSSSPLDIALTADGQTLVAVGEELVRWNIGGSVSELGCAIANRNLTAAEWKQYFGAVAYRKTCTGLS